MEAKQYQDKVREEAFFYLNSMQKRPGRLERFSKNLQGTVNNKIPAAVHQAATAAVKQMIQLSLNSSKYIYPIKVDPSWSLEKREQEVRKVIRRYKLTARVEGAGTGAGGIWLGMADFPLLLSIKMKCLFDIARLYGRDVSSFSERVFLLHIFSAVFSREEMRKEMWEAIARWEAYSGAIADVDWQKLQQEYRDHIDFVKLLQLLPGIGALVGAVVNGSFLEQLGVAAMNAYRLRLT